MAIGSFNINDYLSKLNEEVEEKEKNEEVEADDSNMQSSTPKAEQSVEKTGNPTNSENGLIIPAENKRAYDWLKREYDKAKTEVKVEIRQGGTKFEPEMKLTQDNDSVKDFKPGLFGNTDGTTGKVPQDNSKIENKDSQDQKQNKPGANVTDKPGMSVKGKVEVKTNPKGKVEEDSTKEKDSKKSQLKAKRRIRFKKKQ